MTTLSGLPAILRTFWGKRAADLTIQYRDTFDGRDMVLTDLAMFCNAAAPIQGQSEFDRGVEEGKRRVWLHIARVCRLRPGDFPAIQDGDEL